MDTTSTSNNLLHMRMRMPTPMLAAPGGMYVRRPMLPTRFHFRNIGMNLLASPFTLTCTVTACVGATFWIATQSPFGKVRAF